MTDLQTAESSWPSVVLLVGSDAEKNAFESARAHSLWRGLCQCAETWRVDLSADEDSETDFPRHKSVSPDDLGQMLAGVIKESGASRLILAAGAELPSGFVVPTGVTVCWRPSEGLTPPTGIHEIWTSINTEDAPDLPTGVKLQFIPETFEGPVKDWDEPEADTVAILNLGQGSISPETLRLISERNLIPVACEEDAGLLFSAFGNEITIVPSRKDALHAAEKCVLLGSPEDIAIAQCWAALHDRELIYPSIEDAEADAERLLPHMDPLVSLEAISSALGVWLPEDRKEIGRLVKSNLNLEFKLDRATFHPWVRLFHAFYSINGDVPANSLTGNIICISGQSDGLVNAWVQDMQPPPGVDHQLRATAALALDVTPDQIQVFLDAWGWPVEDFWATDELEKEEAGLISMELRADRTRARVLYWGSAQNTSVQLGKQIAEPAPVSGGVNTPYIFTASGDFPFNRNSLTAIPPEGAGQKFSKFGYFETEHRPSSLKFERMKNSQAGKIGWLIGNGPSVRLEDLDKLAMTDAVCFGFNRFHLAHNQTRLRPDYTVTGDLQMIEDFGQQIVDDSGGTVFVADERPPELMGDFVWVRQTSVFPSLFSFDAPRGVTPGGSSVYVAMQIGYYLGIRQWYIYGADFGFKFSRPRFGGGNFRTASGDGNHFISNYRSGRPWCPPAIENILPSFYGARLLMESEGGFIKNATRGGHLNVFDRISFEDALVDTKSASPLPVM